MSLLESKTAIVTGCNRGIGKAILQKFAENGADVFAVIREKNDDFSQFCEELMNKNSVRIVIICADFSDENEVKKAVKDIMSYKVTIDVLVNNVGVSLPLKSIVMTGMDTIKNVFQVNFFSHMLFTQFILRKMINLKNGSIIFITSSAAFDGGANLEYCASKAAIIGAVRRLAVEMGNFNIRVNAVAPGLTDTDIVNNMGINYIEEAISKNIMKRIGDVFEIADAVLFLASQMSTFITGQVLRVDGGLL